MEHSKNHIIPPMGECTDSDTLASFLLSAPFTVQLLEPGHPEQN